MGLSPTRAPACGASVIGGRTDPPPGVDRMGPHGSPGRVAFLWQSQPRSQVIAQLSPTSCPVLSEKCILWQFFSGSCVKPLRRAHAFVSFAKNSFIFFKTTLLTAKSQNET